VAREKKKVRGEGKGTERDDKKAIDAKIWANEETSPSEVKKKGRSLLGYLDEKDSTRD